MFGGFQAYFQAGEQVARAQTEARIAHHRFRWRALNAGRRFKCGPWRWTIGPSTDISGRPATALSTLASPRGGRARCAASVHRRWGSES